MPITPVATTSGATGPSSGSLPSFDTTGATLITVDVAYYTGGTPSVSDNKGNSYFGLTARNHGGGSGQRRFFCLAAVVGTGHVISIGGAGIYAASIAHAFAGVLGYDRENGAIGAASPLAAGSVTPALNGALILTGLCGDGITAVHTLPAGFTGTVIPGVSGNTMCGSAGYLIQGTAAPINPSWSWTGTHGSAATSVAVFLDTYIPQPLLISQLPVEVLVQSDVPVQARLSQLPIEVLVLPPPNFGRVSQVAVEVATQGPVPAAQVSQVAVEVMYQAVSLLPALVSQVAVEVMYKAAPSAGGVGPWMGDSGGSVWIE